MPTVQGTLYVPELNPIRFHRYGIGAFWENMIPTPDYQGLRYCQKYVMGDIIYLQFLASFNLAISGTITLIDNNSVVQQTFTIYTGTAYGGLNTYYIKSTFPLIAAGIYFIKILVPFADGSITMYSEPIHLAGSHADTLMLNYRHAHTIFDCLFGGVNLPSFYLRVEGGVKSDGFAPGGKFEMYNDLDQRPVMLQTQPFNLYKLLFGNSYGLPNYMADKINRAFALDYTYINNIQYMRNEGAKLEPAYDGNNPLTSWALECRKVENPYSEKFTGGSAIIFDSGVWDDTKTVDDDKIFSTDTVP